MTSNGAPDGLISVIIPVYNEAENIIPCLRRVTSAMAGLTHEILICYDFDEDTTLAAIKNMADAPATIRLVKNAHGRGVAHAIDSGFAAAKGDVAVVTMADLSDPPEIIPAMAEKVRQGAAVVSGSRYMKGGSQKGGPLLKRTLSRAAGLSLCWFGGVPTHDATNSFRAYSTEFLRKVKVESQHGFELGIELTAKAFLMGLKVDEVPSSWVDRTAGQSRFRLWKWLPHYLKWYFKVMIPPVIVWAAWLCGAAYYLITTYTKSIDINVVLFTVLAASFIIAIRRLRGRTRLLDAVFLVCWAPSIQLVAIGTRLLISFAVLVVLYSWHRMSSVCRPN